MYCIIICVQDLYAYKYVYTVDVERHTYTGYICIYMYRIHWAGKRHRTVLRFTALSQRVQSEYLSFLVPLPFMGTMGDEASVIRTSAVATKISARKGGMDVTVTQDPEKAAK